MLFFICKRCDARVGADRRGDPLGPLANETLRLERRAAHDLLDRLWTKSKHPRVARLGVYVWLSGLFDVAEFHVGTATLEQLRELRRVLTFGEVPETCVLELLGERSARDHEQDMSDIWCGGGDDWWE